MPSMKSSLVLSVVFSVHVDGSVVPSARNFALRVVSVDAIACTRIRRLGAMTKAE
jgi:hypothetical protein